MPLTLALEELEERDLLDAAWLGYAHDAQHSAISDVPSQPLQVIRWQTPVDLTGLSGPIHYGSPLVTAANTVMVPVKTSATGDFRVEGRSGSDGRLKWSQPTDYILPPHNWTPPFSPTLTPANRLYFPGAGGTIYYIDNPDQDGASITGHIAFYGIQQYDPTLYNGTVFINTPITSDSGGNIYFGFQVTGSTPLNLESGIARIGADGSGTWIAAHTAAGDDGIEKVLHNCAPALSNDESTVYVAVNGGSSLGYLLALNSTDLSTEALVLLQDPRDGSDARMLDDGTSSPTLGPDGQVYFGIWADNHARGFLLQFSGDLSSEGTPGSFGWDDTASIVPAFMVPSYQGTSSYLVMTKYNNYKEAGGDGVNKLAILDPNDTMIDPITGITVMKEVLTIAGVTPDPVLPAVREWCINTAAVDPFTDSILANSEDGSLYRWNLTTHTFTESLALTTATGEPYTPTIIGVDGTVYAINRATLYAVRAASTPPRARALFASGHVVSDGSQQEARTAEISEKHFSRPPLPRAPGVLGDPAALWVNSSDGSGTPAGLWMAVTNPIDNSTGTTTLSIRVALPTFQDARNT